MYCCDWFDLIWLIMLIALNGLKYEIYLNVLHTPSVVDPSRCHIDFPTTTTTATSASASLTATSKPVHHMSPCIICVTTTFTVNVATSAFIATLHCLGYNACAENKMRIISLTY